MSKVWTVACDATEVPAPLLQALQRIGLAFTPRTNMDQSAIIKSTVVMQYDDVGLPAALPVIDFGNLAEKFRILGRKPG